MINIYLVSRWGEPAEHRAMKPDLEQDLITDTASTLRLLRKGELGGGPKLPVWIYRRPPPQSFQILNKETSSRHQWQMNKDSLLKMHKFNDFKRYLV